MKKVFWLTWMVLGLFLGSALALDFSADSTTVFKNKATGKDQVSKAKIFFAGDKWRSEAEINGLKTIMIFDKAKGVMWNVMVAQKTYMETPISQEQLRTVATKVEKDYLLKKLGEEKINGWPCVKYEIIYKPSKTTGGKMEKFYQWITKDGAFVMKSAAVDGSWTTEYSNIKKGKQDPALFMVPAGYKKFSMPKMPAGMKGFKIPKF